MKTIKHSPKFIKAFDNDKIIALAIHLELEKTEISEIEEVDDDNYAYGNNEYLVLDDYDANVLHEDYLEQYIQDYVLPEIPEAYRYYFDEKSFIEDCKQDGRGYNLASYDGEEYEINVNGTDYYIYRTN